MRSRIAGRSTCRIDARVLVTECDAELTEELRSTTDSRPAPKSAEVPLLSGGAGIRPVLASEEPAQNGQGVERAPQRAPGFFPRLAARIRAFCAIGQPARIRFPRFLHSYIAPTRRPATEIGDCNFRGQKSGP